MGHRHNHSIPDTNRLVTVREASSIQLGSGDRPRDERTIYFIFIFIPSSVRFSQRVLCASNQPPTTMMVGGIDPHPRSAFSLERGRVGYTNTMKMLSAINVVCYYRVSKILGENFLLFYFFSKVSFYLEMLKMIMTSALGRRKYFWKFKFMLLFKTYPNNMGAIFFKKHQNFSGNCSLINWKQS